MRSRCLVQSVDGKSVTTIGASSIVVKMLSLVSSQRPWFRLLLVVLPLRVTGNACMVWSLLAAVSELLRRSK